MPGSRPDSESGPSPSPDGSPTPVKGSVVSFAKGLQQYLEARGELLSIESREAGRLAARKAIMAGAIAVCAVAAYGLVLCAAVSLTGRWLETSFPKTFDKIGWESAALMIGLLHVAAAFLFLIILRRKPAEPLFDVTRREFQKDRQWLSDQQTDSESRS